MLREIIFSFVSGSLIGVPIGALVLYSSWLTVSIRGFLRIALWFPLVTIFAGAAPIMCGITAAMLCACYHYIASQSLLGLQPRQAWAYAAREVLLQVLLITLIAQIWVSHWQWFTFTIFLKADVGLEVFIVLAVLIGLIDWCFHSSFEPTADRRAAIQTQEINNEGLKTIFRFTLLAGGCLVIWQLLCVLGLNVRQPYMVLTAAYYLISLGEIWGAIGLSLLEVIGGIILGGLVAQAVFMALSTESIFRKLLFSMLPLTHISAIVLWLVAFSWGGMRLPGFMYFSHKVIAVGCVTFFPLVRALWGLRDRRSLYRILLAVDDALPIAFVAMAFGEAYAATQGLGFLMVVENATGQGDKALAVCLVTFALMTGLSFAARWAAKMAYSPAEVPQELSI